MMIPYLVHEAASTGSPERLASQAMIVSDQMNDMIAIGLNFAVGCSEDWPVWPENTDHSETLLGNSMGELYAQVCQWWPAGDTPRDFHQPFDADVPVLLLSGELDPVTPPEYGEEAAEQFSDSRHLVANGRGHIVLTTPCMSSIATEFVREADVEDLDTECMDRIGHEPFFLDLLGPAP
ncbi:MAG: alpha/beta hydrolase [Xanthomonadales bacterium]|nr:alpha/beta hydrolase [Xanthomonadales bacterium]